MTRVWLTALKRHHPLRHHPLLLGLLCVPLTLWMQHAHPDQSRTLFFLSLLAILPLAALLSLATEHLAERTGNMTGGLLNATLGNTTELVIGLTALHAGLFDLVKASLAGAVIANALFTLGFAFLWGGLRHHVQALNLEYVHMQSGLLLLATIALLVPSALGMTGSPVMQEALQPLSVGLSVVLIAVYLLGLLFAMGTHRELIEHQPRPTLRGQAGWPVGVSVTLLVLATAGVALVSQVFVNTVETVAVSLGLSQAFIGFILVALVGGAAEMYSALHAAAVNRNDLSVAIAMGSSTQLSLFVAPLLVLSSYWLAPQPMNLQFPAVAVVMVLLSTMSITTILSSRRTTWYSGVLLLSVYGIFALTLFLVQMPGGH